MNSQNNYSVKFLYFSHETLQVPRVAMQCMVALCEAAAHCGADSEIVSFVNKVHPSEPKHPPFEKLYGIKFPVAHPTYSLLIKSYKFKFLIEIQRFVIYFIHILFFIMSGETRRYKYFIVSSRNYSILGMLAALKKIMKEKFIVLADVHNMPQSLFKNWVLKVVDGSVCTSRALQDTLIKKLNLPSEKLQVAHNAVKIDRFYPQNDFRDKIRTRHNLAAGKKIICYTGKVYYPYREIEYYLEVAKKLNPDAILLIVGGRPDHVIKWKDECKKREIRNVIFQSFVDPSEIPDYQRTADLLIMYYPPLKQFDCTSSAKLFEYLASGVPVVASRTKSIEEIISDGENGFLVEPGKPLTLAETINRLLTDRRLLTTVGRNAQKRAAEFSWEKRAQCFLDFGRSLAF